MNCRQCNTGFEVTDSDRAFYTKMEVPKPTLCVDCRMQRRLSWRNESNLFHRNCDLCQKKMISVYHASAPFPVYCLPCWWSDDWSPFDYGRDYDFERPFFEQFADLQKVVPRMALMQHQNENSEYTNNVSNLKDCYLLFSSDYDRNCMYGVWVANSKDCLDNLLIDRCELCYECVFSQDCYNCKYVLFSSNCSDSAFLFDCKDSRNCFMSYGLRNKEYVIANKQYSKEEYFEKLKEFPISSAQNLEKAKKLFFDTIKQAVRPHLRKKGTILDSTGDYLINTTNCENCYELYEAKDCKNILGGFELKDAMDCCYVAETELGYEICECVPMPFNSIGCVNSYTGGNLKYSDSCMNNCSDLLGCISLRQSKFAILNKRYSEEEYKELSSKIIEQMRHNGEYGEFFPSSISPFSYNVSQANEDFPLTKEECESRGLGYQERDEMDYQPQTYQIPDDIKEVKDDVVGQILACQDCTRNYKVVSQELQYYRDNDLPIPRKCTQCRQKARRELRSSRRLFSRKCNKCQVEIQTTYSPESPEAVYCEKCYLAEVH